ncbi:MAG TPA: gamma-glutamyl-gamma-aminobutyrate hydrolase family protein [Candidatus Binataceae bacterium]|nr:gamma-glutamyl-gamma-aminobutyrate hydrolase family protein [Candidatus Binataceae bacterium]
MLKVASWIRACDQASFERAFADFHEIELENARLGPIDLTAADGLLLSGGEDISASFLHQPAIDPALIIDADPLRDEWEFEALRIVLERNLPLLAICRGIQVLNVALGGTLRLDIPNHDVIETVKVHPLRHSLCARHRFEAVNSTHHQALEKVADGLTVEAWSPADDVIEQVRMERRAWTAGVQYHPERHPSYRPLFQDFVSHLAGAGK